MDRMDRIKRIVKKTPVVRNIARAAMRTVAARRAKSFNSADYWENRYRGGRTSGAGSYNRLALFKAEVLNRFVREHDVRSIIEFGSGDGSQLELAEYPRYIGVDISKTAIGLTRERFAHDPAKTFLHSEDLRPEHRCELSMSLDVVYHLVEGSVFEAYLAQLFDYATRYVIVYSSNEDRPSDSVHVKHRRFTDWVGRERPHFRQIEVIRNPYPEDLADIDNTSFADFYFFEKVVEDSQA